MKYLLKTSPEPLVQIKNNFTKVFLMMPSNKIAQMGLLCFKQNLLNYWDIIKMVLMLSSTKLIRRFSLATRAKLEISLNHIISP